VENEESITATGVVEPPRGMFPGRLDDKARLKVPAAFQQYLASLSERKLFITSLDRRVAQIYPMNVWRDNEKFLSTFREDPDAAANIFFNAMDLGSEAEMDAQGRITFNPELRRELALENQELHLQAFPSGRVQVLTEALYQEQKRLAAQKKTADDLKTLEKAGLR
jgi:DNA-binding transcriptional regulator/RsmH inhibitor MraZ